MIGISSFNGIPERLPAPGGANLSATRSSPHPGGAPSPKALKSSPTGPPGPPSRRTELLPLRRAGGREESVLCGSEAKSLPDLRFRVSGLVSSLDLGRRACSAAATQRHSRTAELHKEVCKKGFGV